MDLFEKLTAKARAHRQRIVLPEGLEPRTLTAADRIIADGLADIILIGNPTDIYTLADSMKLSNIRQATIADPLFHAPRKSKGISMEEARLTTHNPLYLGCLMVKAGDADGQVAGAMNTTGNVLRAAFQVIKTMPGINVVSGAFVMLLPEGMPYGTDGILIFADCAVVPILPLQNWLRLQFPPPAPPATSQASSRALPSFRSRPKARPSTNVSTRLSKPPSWHITSIRS